MKTNIWMPLFIADYVADTRRLSTIQHGAYLLLMIEYWRSAEPLPDDDAILARLTLMSPEEWRTHRAAISTFFIVGEGVWKHESIDAELLKAAANRKAKSEAGKSGAAKRRHAFANDKLDGKAMAEALANPSRIDNPSPSPSPIDQRESRSPVEPLALFPKTESEAKQAAVSVGCSEEFAASTWSKAMGRGGRDAKDIPIRSWPHHLATEWTYEKNRQAKASISAKRLGSQVPLWKQIKTTEEEIAGVSKKLAGITQSASTVFPERAAKEERQRKPLREQKRKLVEQLSELKAKEAAGG